MIIIMTNYAATAGLLLLVQGCFVT